MYKIAALYKFTDFNNLPGKQRALREFGLARGVIGTLLIAEEGINGTIAAEPDALDEMIAFIRTLPGLETLSVKYAFSQDKPFNRFKVRIKKEIVTFGIKHIDPKRAVGTYVKPDDWNELIARDDVLVIDTRNDYEIALGKFKHAEDPETKTFKEFVDYVAETKDKNPKKKIAMYCTGGIRCEKASAYMMAEGFDEVYHLEGGILKYLETIPEENSLWEGECFVFDNRVTVDHKLQPGHYELCHACRHTLSEEDKQSPHFIQDVVCPHCVDTQTPENRARAEERAKQIQLARARSASN